MPWWQIPAGHSIRLQSRRRDPNPDVPTQRSGTNSWSACAQTSRSENGQSRDSELSTTLRSGRALGCRCGGAGPRRGARARGRRSRRPAPSHDAGLDHHRQRRPQPYAVVVAPASAGKIQKGDVLVDNFNNISNLQGTGGTIVDYNPSTRSTTLFAKLPQNLPQCPGGIGLSTAMTMLRSGWVIVGSTPSTDGTTATRAPAVCWCSIPTASSSPSGRARISRSLGQHGGRRQRRKATLFVSMAGYDVPGPDQARSRNRSAGGRRKGDSAAHAARDSRERTAEGRRARR